MREGVWFYFMREGVWFYFRSPLNSGQQMWASGRNDPGSSPVIGSSFATEIGSNFIIGV